MREDHGEPLLVLVDFPGLRDDLPAAGAAVFARALEVRERRACLVVFRGGGAGGVGEETGFAVVDRDAGEAAGSGVALIRPLVPESGYPAEGRVWESNRTAIAEAAAGGRQQRNGGR